MTEGAKDRLVGAQLRLINDLAYQLQLASAALRLLLGKPGADARRQAVQVLEKLARYWQKKEAT